MRFPTPILFLIAGSFISGLQAQETGELVPAPPASVPQVTPGEYLEPDLTESLFSLEKLALPPAEQDALVRQLAELVRNLPEEPKLTLLWKARLLSLAMRIRAEDRSCVVANGQLRRGVVPAPLPGARDLSLEERGLLFLRWATTLMGADGIDNRTLCGYLLDIAVLLDPSHRTIREKFYNGGQPVSWKPLVQRRPVAQNFETEEIPDLLSTVATVSLAVRNKDGEIIPQEIQLTAEKLPDKKAPLQIALSGPLAGLLQPRLMEIQQLLRPSHPAWPGGWKIELKNPAYVQENHAGYALALAVGIESLIRGESLNPKILVTCGLDPASGSIIRGLSWDALQRQIFGSDPWDAILVSPAAADRLEQRLIAQPELILRLAQRPVVMVREIGDVHALCRLEHPVMLAGSLQRFADVAAKVREHGMTAVNSPTLQKHLEQVLEVHQNNRSAHYLLLAGQRRMPATMSITGAYEELMRLGQSVLHVGRDGENLRRPPRANMEMTPWARTDRDISRLRPKLPKQALPLADAMTAQARRCQSFVLNPPNTQKMIQQVRSELNHGNALVKNARRELAAQLPPDPDDPPPVPPDDLNSPATP